MRIYSLPGRSTAPPACQGFIAGVNAALKVKEKEPFILSRSESYIGVLIDDLITKGTNEPYRMFTSRVEFRLLLREDNADLRLSKKALSLGLLSQGQYEKVRAKEKKIQDLLDWLKRTKVYPREEKNQKLTSWGTSPLKEPTSLASLLKRPEIDFQRLKELGFTPINSNSEIDQKILWTVEIDIKYEGYIERMKKEMEKFEELEEIKISPDFDYSRVKGISNEAKEKLSKIRPVSLGQAYRIPGISPATILNLMIYLKRR